MRLQVFLSHNGVCSRREALNIVQDGRVRVNGSIVYEPSFSVTGDEDIRVDNKKIQSKAYTYIMLHKPSGVTTTKDDPHADKTVMELLPATLAHLAPVGRLDRDTEGLLLLTNDGTWAQGLMHPKFHLPKVYRVSIQGQLKEANQKIVQAGGQMIEGRKTAPCRITDVRYNGTQTELTITIHEGRKRQVRTMFYLVGHKVTYLKRVAIGTVDLGELKLGAWRELTVQEVKSLSGLNQIK